MQASFHVCLTVEIHGLTLTALKDFKAQSASYIVHFDLFICTVF